MANEEGAHRDMPVLIKAAPQHVVYRRENRQREGNGLELPQPLLHCLKTRSAQSNGAWTLVAGPGNQL